MPESVLNGYFEPNLKALESFQSRKKGGLGLSERIWQNNQRFKQEMEMALDIGLGEGLSAQKLSQNVRGFLKEPEKLFRRVRNKFGQLTLSKKAKAYHPGQGVYRSSYKNAARLTRTEINMAYREADYQRFQQLDFVVGYEVKRSKNPYNCPICGPLAGKYPKTFKFRGWHPNCKCFIISILATPEEVNEMVVDKLIEGKSPKPFSSVNQVKELPQGFYDWINNEANKKRLLTSASQPFFIRDNYLGGEFKNGLKPLFFTPSPAPVPVKVPKPKNENAYTQAQLKKALEASKFDYDFSRDHFQKEYEAYKKTKHSKMKYEEWFLIQKYTTSYYKTINGYLRSGRTDKNSDTIVRVIRSGLAKIKPEKQQVVFRGTSTDKIERITELRESFTQGKPLFDLGFHSTSTNYSVANNFKTDQKKYHISYEVTHKTGANIEPITYAKGEDEVLFPPNTKFKVNKITEISETRFLVQLEQL